jgi:hypothetical protein
MQGPVGRNVNVAIVSCCAEMGACLLHVHFVSFSVSAVMDESIKVCVDCEKSRESEVFPTWLICKGSNTLHQLMLGTPKLLIL